LFVLRANTVKASLQSLAPGGENILNELRPEEFVDPDKRIRVLTTEELVNLTKAWQRWPFKMEGVEFDSYVTKDGYGNEKDLMGSIEWEGR
jgi:hypothetical protein